MTAERLSPSRDVPRLGLLNLSKTSLFRRLPLKTLNVLPRIPYGSSRLHQSTIRLALCILSLQDPFAGGGDGNILAVAHHAAVGVVVAYHAVVPDGGGGVAVVAIDVVVDGGGVVSLG